MRIKLKRVEVTFGGGVAHGLRRGDLLEMDGRLQVVDRITSQHSFVVRNPRWYEALWWSFRRWCRGLIAHARAWRSARAAIRRARGLRR